MKLKKINTNNLVPKNVPMFCVECFYTMNKRKKLLEEFKGLPKCDITGLPQHLGEISRGTRWCSGGIFPEQTTVITVTKYFTTRYR